MKQCTSLRPIVGLQGGFIHRVFPEIEHAGQPGRRQRLSRVVKRQTKQRMGAKVVNRMGSALSRGHGAATRQGIMGLISLMRVMLALENLSQARTPPVGRYIYWLVTSPANKLVIHPDGWANDS